MTALVGPCFAPRSGYRPRELDALRRVEREARDYARHTHGNLNGAAYRAREEARDRLLDALAALDALRA